MALRLREHALARVDEDDGEVGRGGAGRHVARVLLVPGGVGDDELAPLGGEVSVGDVDGDALLALREQPVDEKAVVDLAARRALLGGVPLERVELVLEDHVRVVEQPPDERALAVVDAPGGEEAQDLLPLVPRQVGRDVPIDELELAHQK